MTTDYRAVIQQLLDTVKPKYTDPEEIVAVASSWRFTHMLAGKPMGTYLLPAHVLPLPST